MSRWRLLVFSVALLATVGACSSGGRQAAASAPAPATLPDVEGPLGLPSTTGVVVSQSRIGSEVGAEILRKGGNAIDAAIATGMAMVITNPSNANLGGGGFLVVRRPNGEVETIDFRETAPLKATADMYVDPATGRSRWQGSGYLAPGVPGTVAGFYLAHQRYGKLPWKDLVMPAYNLAAKGVVLPSLASAINGLTQGTGRMTRFPSSMRAYAKAGGGPWAESDTIKLPDLARSMLAIAEGGRDAFYKGWIADSIDADMRRNGGLITKEDLARYQAVVREPVRATYKGYELAMMGPPTGGGVIVAEALNILENYDLKSMGQTSPQAVHLVLEAMRRAFLDRARYLGDPDFNRDMPIARLTSKAYAKELAATISPDRASVSAVLGKDIMSSSLPSESEETTHYSAIDKDGMAVSITYTLEGGYGSAVVASGTGFILNNEMGDFNRVPGQTDSTGSVGTPPNQIAPGKRMLSSMSPTIVSRNGKVVLITGSPGGRTIPSTVLGVLLGFMEFGYNGRQAVDAPRINHQWMPDRGTVETDATPAIPQATLDALAAMGHSVRAGGGGSAHSIWVDQSTGIAYGVADRRQRGSFAAK
jgi:gamma-glutamyltranspeptidase/glutathione hydrolase